MLRNINKFNDLQLMSEHIEKTAADEGVEKTFYIDESIGRETIVQLTSENLNNVNLTVKGPNLTQSIIGTSSDTAVITVKIPGKTQVHVIFTSQCRINRSYKLYLTHDH